MVDIELAIRRRIINSKPGETHTLPTGHLSPDLVKRRAKLFARDKGYPIEVLDTPNGFTFRRLAEGEAQASAYSDMDRLQIGESHLFEVPPALHQRVRMAASTRNRKGDVLLSCSREGDFIRVTRLPLTDAEVAAYKPGPVRSNASKSKYGLERLATEPELLFPAMPYSDMQSLRVSVSTKGKREGWRLTCSMQPDGGLKVRRLDLDGGDHA